MAPTNYLWVNQFGRYYVAGINSNNLPNPKIKGDFKIFYPKKRGGNNDL